MTEPLKTQPAVTVERATQFVKGRYNSIRSLTPELLGTTLDAFKVGYLAQYAQLCDDVEERDFTLKIVAPKRRKAIARNGWEIVKVSELEDAQEDQADEHKAALEYFYNNLTATNAVDENETGEVSLLVRQMADAIGKRYAVHELVWAPSASGLSATFRFTPLAFFEHTTSRLRYIPTLYGINGVDMNPTDWLVTVADGIMPACLIAYMYKSLSMKDWIIYSERHGMPGIHGKTDAQPDSTEWEKMVDAVQNFAADWAIVTNSGASIEAVDISAKGELPYPPLVEAMSRAITSLWRGGDLATMSAGAGAGQGASLQGDEGDILEADDAMLITETLRRQIDRVVIAYTFGPGVKPLAYFQLKSRSRPNVDQDIKIDTFLRDSGVPLAVDASAERYGRSVAEEGEAVLLAAPAVAGAEVGGQRSEVRAEGLKLETGNLKLQNSEASGLRSQPSGLVASAVDQTLAAREAMFEEWLSKLEKTLPDNPTTAQLEAAIADMPKELLTKENVAKLAGISEAAMGSAVIEELTTESTEARRGSRGMKIHNTYDPAQERDANGRWAETGDGGMSWKTRSGADATYKNGSVEFKKGGKTLASTHMDDLVEPDAQMAELIRKGGKDPSQHVVIKGSKIAVHKDDVGPYAEARRRTQKIDADREKVWADKKAKDAAVEKPLIEAAHAHAEELRKQIPSDHVAVDVEQNQNDELMPTYRVGGKEVPWQEVTVHGHGTATRPGAMAPFHTETVASIHKDKLSAFEAKESAHAAEKEAKRQSAEADRAAKAALAKSTGKKQELRRWTETRKGKEGGESGEYEHLVQEHINPDGTISTTATNLH